MANQTQPDRWESPMLAAAMAVTGTLFLFDKLHSLMHGSVFSWHLLPYFAAAALVALGVSLLVVQHTAPACAGTVEMRGNNGRERRSA